MRHHGVEHRGLESLRAMAVTRDDDGLAANRVVHVSQLVEKRCVDTGSRPKRMAVDPGGGGAPLGCVQKGFPSYTIGA